MEDSMKEYAKNLLYKTAFVKLAIESDESSLEIMKKVGELTKMLNDENTEKLLNSISRSAVTLSYSASQRIQNNKDEENIDGVMKNAGDFIASEFYLQSKIGTDFKTDTHYTKALNVFMITLWKYASSKNILDMELAKLLRHER